MCEPSRTIHMVDKVESISRCNFQGIVQNETAPGIASRISLYFVSHSSSSSSSSLPLPYPYSPPLPYLVIQNAFALLLNGELLTAQNSTTVVDRRTTPKLEESWRKCMGEITSLPYSPIVVFVSVHSTVVTLSPFLCPCATHSLATFPIPNDLDVLNFHDRKSISKTFVASC